VIGRGGNANAYDERRRIPRWTFEKVFSISVVISKCPPLRIRCRISVGLTRLRNSNEKLYNIVVRRRGDFDISEKKQIGINGFQRRRSRKKYSEPFGRAA